MEDLLDQNATRTRRTLVTAEIGTLAAGLAIVSTFAVVDADAATGAVAAVPVAAAGAGDDRVLADLTAGRAPVVPALVPPAGHVPSSVVAAKGVQVCRCTTAAGAAAPAWTFVEPVATLAGTTVRPHRVVTGVHFRGPSWQSDQDGSLVEGRAKASVPVAGTIPHLLIEAVRTQGTGAFGRVTFIQRLATRGGVAPTGACTQGTITGVPYRAVYRFFVPAA